MNALFPKTSLSLLTVDPANLGRKFLSELVAARTYAETLPSGRKETHHENVERVIAMHVKKFPRHEDMIRGAFELVHQKIVMPSMRSAQFSGRAIERSNARMYNCFFAAIDSQKSFADALWLSMNGGGVGYSVQRHHIAKLPVVPAGDASELFVVSDDKEGWADSMLRLQVNPLVRFDYSPVRDANSPLSTGGTASGPKPLRDAHQRIRAILKAAVGRRLHPIEAHDIMCHQADCVVVGGVRRAALICLFSSDDKEMLACKSGDWWEKNPQRARANNSVALYRDDANLKEQISSMMAALYQSGSGDPGLFISADPDRNIGTNPCQPADAKLLSQSGVTSMGAVQVGDTIWSGKQWTKIINKVATGIKPVFVYKTSVGSFIGTANHRVVQNGIKMPVGQAKSIDACSSPDGYNPSEMTYEIVETVYRGDEPVYDITVEDDEHTYWTDGLLVSNCGEISLRSKAACVAYDTQLITKDGITRIGDVVNTPVDVWNGTNWSTVTPVKTGENEPIFRVRVSDGSYLDCTSDHKWSVKTRFQKSFSTVKTKDLPRFSRYAVQLEPTTVVHAGGVDVQNAYTLGVVIGDGHVTGSDILVELFGKKINLPVAGNRGAVRATAGHATLSQRVNCTRVFDDFDFVKRLKYGSADDLDALFGWSVKSCLEFFAGLIDTDGSETSTGGVRYYAANEAKIRKLQLLLTKCGIRSSVCLMVEARNQVVSVVNGNDIIRRNSMWYLQITDCSRIPTHRVSTAGGHKSLFKSKYQTIVDVEDTGRCEDVFCFEEEERHQAVFGNVLTFQCNLSEVNVAACHSQEDFVRAASAAALIGTLQACYTDFKYVHPDWQKNCEEEALLGVSMTGQAENWGLISDPAVLRAGAAEMLATNERVARLLGINPAARIGCTKPSGSTSMYVGTTSGIHGSYAPHFLRRMQIEKASPLAQYLIDRFGIRDPNEGGIVEHSVHKPSVIAVTAPCATPNAIVTSEESAIQLMERAKHVKQNWIIPSHRSGPNYHSVSLTVSYADHEQQEITEWVQRNVDSVSGAAFFPRDGGTHKNLQMPFEAVSRETFELWTKKFEGVTIDLTEVDFSKQVDERVGELACAGGNCDIS